MKKLALVILFVSLIQAHPVPYSIELVATYDESTKEASITCKSDSKNKCGLHNFDLLDKDDKKILSARFPFLKSQKKVSCKKKPKKMIFFLRKIPEHQYIVYF